MATINMYPTKETIDGSELLVCFDSSHSDTRKFSVAALNTYIQSLITANISGYATQYSAPSATGFSVSITDNQVNVHLILTPTAGFATGTITLPSATNALDGQCVLVNSTQLVTTLTIGANGATSVTGAPTSLAANGYFTLKYDRVSSTWYRVG